ncbi:uncharacterized protein MKK02DRAFT_40155 [Dioszegia hungarica]|uniref:Uncharacterized protein n=1 Tax=Dioszegia hungarica TaxID=4972 RepID=A0AA38HGP5_9TREE|nr:uncharacterized protein MKK02DRAFT_40155 [Dioszegia hungarica]KAI9639828.1 hypothetical protein MKK02DRAFT_40155 [Dioszegia hungarica]
MGFVFEPIVIAAIAAGGTAFLILLTVGSIWIYRRYHPRPPPTSRSGSRRSGATSTRSGAKQPIQLTDRALASASASSSAGSSTRKSPHSYHTPIVPLVQPPPHPSHRRNPSNQYLLQPSTALSPSSDEYILGTPDSIPNLTSGSKLRKYEKSPSSVSPRPLARPTAARTIPIPDTPSDQQMISPQMISDRRTSAGSSVMLITYEQGLAKMGLSTLPRPPLPTASTSASAHPAYPIPSPYSNYRSVGAASPHEPYIAETPGQRRSGSGSERSYRKPVPLVGGGTGTGAGGGRSGRSDRSGSGSHASRSESERYPEPEIGRGWEEADTATESRQGAWLPSYYQPAAEKKSKWGGRI